MQTKMDFKEMAHKAYIECYERFKGREDKTALNACKFAISKFLSLTGTSCGYLEWSEQICNHRGE